MHKWIITAWQRISPEMTVKFFKSAVQWMGLIMSDMMWNGSEEDGKVESECEQDEDTDCGDGDSDTDW